MKGQQLYDFLVGLYDFADAISALITPENQGTAGAREQAHYTNARYFLTLTHIEWIFDRLGRELIYLAAREYGQVDASDAIHEANRRLDDLRGRIEALALQYDFSRDLTIAGEKLASAGRQPGHL